MASVVVVDLEIPGIDNGPIVRKYKKLIHGTGDKLAFRPGRISGRQFAYSLMWLTIRVTTTADVGNRQIIVEHFDKQNVSLQRFASNADIAASQNAARKFAMGPMRMDQQDAGANSFAVNYGISKGQMVIQGDETLACYLAGTTNAADFIQVWAAFEPYMPAWMYSQRGY